MFAFVRISECINAFPTGHCERNNGKSDLKFIFNFPFEHLLCKIVTGRVREKTISIVGADAHIGPFTEVFRVDVGIDPYRIN